MNAAVKLKGWKDVLDCDFARPRATDRTLAPTRRLSGRVRGNVRVSTGRIRTDHAFERYRRAALARIRASTSAQPEPDNAIFGSNLREAARAIGIIRRWWTGRAARR